MPIVVLLAAGAIWIWSDSRRADFDSRLVVTFTALSNAACDEASPQSARVRWAMPVIAAAWKSRMMRFCQDGRPDERLKIKVEPAATGDSLNHVRFVLDEHGAFVLDVRMESPDAVPLVTAVRDL